MRDPNGIYVRLPLENAANVRDLGGYPGHGGRPTRFKAFLRSDSLSRLNEDEIRFLMEYGVRTVIDLRTEHELISLPNPFTDAENVDFHHISFLKGDLTGAPFDLEDTDPMGTMYIEIFDVFYESVIEAFKTIASAKDGCVLFHCSAGKDRTGILSYIILSVAGVNERDIVANYRVTDTYYIPYLRQTYDQFDTIPLKYLQSKARTMERAIRHLTGAYGSVAGYLRHHGVTDREIDAVRDRIL